MNDYQLQLDLDEMTRQYFFSTCDPLLQSILSQCAWRLTSQGKALTLIIVCPTLVLNWLILEKMAAFATVLGGFAESALIRVHPPLGYGEPLEMRVDERSLFESC
jgi:hypothetical protein